MPSFIESLAAGGKKWGEYAQGVETARTAPQMAQAELDTNQANARLAVQNADLNQYNVDAAGLIKQATTPVGPSQDYSAIYSKTSSLKQKQDLAKQKLAKAEQLKNATMASGKFSEATRKAYEDAQAESKAVDTEFKTFQAESLRKVLDPALTARDQSSWNMAKPQLAEATAEAAVQEAIKSGVPEENLARLRNDVRNQTLASLPKAWGPSAQNFVRSKGAELKSLETSNKMDEAIRKEEEHKSKMKLEQSQTAENYAKRDKALAEAKGGNPKALAEVVKSARADYNTASLAANRFSASEQRELEMKLKVAKEATTDWTGKEEKKAAYELIQAEMDEFTKNKKAADQALADTEADWKLARDQAKAKGVDVPKETAPPSKQNMSDYTVTPELAAQGYTAETVLTELAKANPGFTNEQYVQIAIEKGYFPKNAAKVTPKVDTRLPGQRTAAARREQIKDNLAEVTFGKLYSALSSVEQVRIDREAKLKAQSELYSRK